MKKDKSLCNSSSIIKEILDSYQILNEQLTVQTGAVHHIILQC